MLRNINIYKKINNINNQKNDIKNKKKGEPFLCLKLKN